jgi:hypothetical protein
MPPVVLGYDVEHRKPGTFGAESCAVPQPGVELGSGGIEPIRCQSPWSAGDLWARYSPDVEDSILADFALDSGWASEVREFGEDAVDRCVAIDGLDPGDQRAGSFDRYVQRVTASSSRLFWQSTRRPK